MTIEAEDEVDDKPAPLPPEKFTFDDLWCLAAREETSRAVDMKVWGFSRVRERERQGFAKICGMIALFEEFERDFLQVVNRRRTGGAVTGKPGNAKTNEGTRSR